MDSQKPMRARQRRLVAVLILAFALTSVPAPATAVPETLASRLSEARRIKSQVESLDSELEIVVERYNAAADALARTEGAVEQTREDLARTRRRLKSRQGALSRRVRGIYRDGDVSFVEVVLSTSNFLDFLQQLDMLLRIGAHDATIVRDIKATKRALTRHEKDLTVRLRVRKDIASRVAADKADISSRLTERERILSGVKREIAMLRAREAAEQARIRRAAAARLRRAGGGSTSAPSGGSGTYRPSGKGHAEVVRVAFAQLGKPYHWAAAGPDAFDCSGLTMYCYGQIGISLSHSSSAQFSEGERVGRSELEPGDLVFFGSPIHHVGIYIGGGQYIHAPNTGDVVKISDLDRGDFAGGARP